MLDLIERLACWQGGWLYRIVYRYRCPAPIDGHDSARSCFEAGLCGCDNEWRFRKR